MSIKCKRNGEIKNIEWLFLKQAWVPAITVCYERLYTPTATSTYDGNCFVYIDSNYVDYATEEQLGGEGASLIEHEANNVIASLQDNNIKVTTTTGVEYSDWETTLSRLGRKGMLILPELETNVELYNGLDDDSRNGIRNWISNGGNLVMFAADTCLDFLNNEFEFSLNSTSVSEPILITSEGSDLFVNAPNELLSLNATVALDSTTLPEGSVVIYIGDEVNQSLVTKIPYGDGNIYVLGYDWYDAAPIGSQDGNWISLLIEIVKKRG
jgi:hypothetical protein